MVGRLIIVPPPICYVEFIACELVNTSWGISQGVPSELQECMMGKDCHFCKFE